MAIQEQNIVFVKSQVMDDVPEGGGLATGTVIVDGQMNNVFEDISDLDRAYGRFNLRKIFLAVRTLSTDLYGGAKTVITALPADPALGYTLFTTNAPSDTRAEAANAVEAYLYKGPLWNGWLYENHIAGMRAIALIQPVDSRLPVIGQSLCLVLDEGLPAQQEQYVRVTKVEYRENQFFESGGDYSRWIVTLSLSDALRFDFPGHSALRSYLAYSYTGKTRVRETTVADATRYYGAKPLALAAAVGDLQVRAASMFTQLVPSAQTETPLVSRALAGEVVPVIAAASSAITYTPAQSATIAPNGRLVLRTGAEPGSISVTVGSVTITDNALGGALRNGAVVGSVVYATGEILFNASAPSATGTATVTYTPAAPAPQQAHTRALPVTVENRRLNWVETLIPLPAPGTLEVSFLSQGNWYTVRDNGLGALSGSDPAFGAGVLSYVTGAASLTLGALPDAGSQIMMTWGSPAHFAVRTGADTIAAQGLHVKYATAHSPILPSSLSIEYVVGGAVLTASDNGVGVISGGGVSGTIVYASGEVSLEFSTPPDMGADIQCAYTWRDGAVMSGLTATLSGQQFTVPGVPPFQNDGTLSLLASTAFGGVSAQARINPTGEVWIDSGGLALGEHNVYQVFSWENQPIGVFNAATGVVTLTSSMALWLMVYDDTVGKWSGALKSAPITGVSSIKILRDGAAYDPNSVTGELVTLSAGLELDLTPAMAQPLVPGSLMFRVCGKTYVDRAGSLYVDVSPVTGSGTLAGTVDYEAGVARLTWWQNNTAVSRAVDACLTVYGTAPARHASFRTPVAPVKPESVSVTAVTMDGEQITGVADPDGNIVGAAMRGTVNYEFGTASIEFGALAGAVWEPKEVAPATIRYNAVGYSYLPLNADILGIDPVRLPPDGRVPIYRPGDVVMVMHAAGTAPETVGNGGAVSCGRGRIAWVRILDANGDVVTSGYTLDRDAGVVTFTDVTGIVMPVTVRHTVGDLRQITDAQVSGQLTLARALTHTYPVEGSLVASCLIHGDRRARVSAVWDQQTWDGTWVDSRVGSNATATLDTIAYPIAVTNEGAETERWLLRWTTTTNVELIGETRGLVYSGPFTADIAPINPRTRNPDGTGGTPYLTIPLAANGGGWGTGNVVRINTVGALADMWLARSIQQSDMPTGDGADGCELYALGNVDRP